MLKLQPIDRTVSRAEMIARVFRLIVQGAGGWVSQDRKPNEYERIRLEAKMKNDDYTITLFVYENGNHFLVGTFLSEEKDSDMGSPHWMPAEWTLIYSLKPGEKWRIDKPADLVALFEAHTKWSKFEGYFPAFERKDKNI
jgi:hypothetical protein